MHMNGLLNPPGAHHMACTRDSFLFGVNGHLCLSNLHITSFKSDSFECICLHKLTDKVSENADVFKDIYMHIA